MKNNKNLGGKMGGLWSNNVKTISDEDVIYGLLKDRVQCKSIS
jgi:hypothetical protein